MLSLLLSLAIASGASVQGFVRSEGALEPIDGATVSIEALDRRVITDQRGYFVLADLPEGEWRVVASALGYGTREITIVSRGDGRMRLDFALELVPVELHSVDVRSIGRSVGAQQAPGGAGPLPTRLEGDAQLKYVPGLAEPDVLRAVQMLPAVAAMSDYSTALYVRGGSADQSVIELDGVPLYNPYHLGGVFAAITADAVSTVDVHTGALPAHAADRLSGVVSVQSRHGPRDGVRASGSIGLISSTATIEGPLSSRGSFLVSGRRTYVDAVSRAAYALDAIDMVVPYGFSDVLVNATHEVGALGALTLTGYLDHEGVSMPQRMLEDQGMGDEPRFSWGSRMLSLGYRQPIGGDLVLQARAGFTDFTGDFALIEYPAQTCQTGIGCTPPKDTVTTIDGATRIRNLIGAASVTWFGARNQLRVGVRADHYRLSNDLRSNGEYDDFLAPMAERGTLSTLAAYAEDEVRLNERVRMRLGLRALHAGELGTALLPRAGIEVRLTPSLTMRAGGGRYAQVLRSLRDDESVISSFIAYDILALQPEETGLARSWDLVAGLDWEGENGSARVSAYTREMDGLLMRLPAGNAMDRHPLLTDSLLEGTGRARGVELQAFRRLGNLQLGVSYALSDVSRSAGGRTFTPRFARTHTLDATASLPLGSSGLLSTRLSYATGQPYTPVEAVADSWSWDAAAGEWRPGRQTVVNGEFNSERLPSYTRLDVAVRRDLDVHWFGRDIALTPYFQVLNVLNAKNVVTADPETGGTAPRLNFLPQLPVLPTFGIEWRF